MNAPSLAATGKKQQATRYTRYRLTTIIYILLVVASLLMTVKSAHAAPVQYQTNSTGTRIFSTLSLACSAAWVATGGDTGAYRCPGLSSPSGYCWTFRPPAPTDTACLANCVDNGKGQLCPAPVGLFSSVTFTCEAGYELDAASTSCVAANSCPANMSGTPCVCESGFVPDPSGAAGCVQEQYTITLQNPLADVEPSHTTDVYANTSSTVYAQVVDAQTNQPKAGVQVQFSVDVVANTGGHDGNHYQMRPKGKLLDCGFGSEVETTVCTTQQDGRATVTFNAPIVSGTHTITAECVSPTCTGTASGNINVKVPGLERMPYSTLYVFVGGEAGKAHTDNHYLTPAASDKVQQLSEDYHSRFPFSPVLRLNDASLVWGGVFDVKGSWTAPHIQHRLGIVIDVRANQRPDAIPNSNDRAFQLMILRRRGSYIYESQGTSNEHYHIHLLGIKG